MVNNVELKVKMMTDGRGEVVAEGKREVVTDVNQYN
jgi:hypothetical protein